MPVSSSMVEVDVRIDAALATGDRAAVQLMVDHYTPGLRGWLRRRQGRWLSNADIDDIVQEALMYVWERRADFEGSKGRAKTLLFQTAKRRTIDQFRARRREEGILTGTDGQAQEVACPAPSPLLEAVHNEELEAVKGLLNELSDFEREALLASRRSPNGYADELAERLGKEPGAVRVATNRAITKLRKRIKEEGHDIA